MFLLLFHHTEMFDFMYVNLFWILAFILYFQGPTYSKITEKWSNNYSGMLRMCIETSFLSLIKKMLIHLEFIMVKGVRFGSIFDSLPAPWGLHSCSNTIYWIGHVSPLIRDAILSYIKFLFIFESISVPLSCLFMYCPLNYCSFTF